LLFSSIITNAVPSSKLLKNSASPSMQSGTARKR
jgi:hypothetical protein